MHAAAIGAWLAGDWHGASAILDDLLFSGRPTCWRCRSGTSSTSSSASRQPPRPPGPLARRLRPSRPAAAAVRGMYAFGLEESGQYEQAEEVGMSAIDVHPDDVWAIHAVVHTMEMRGLVDRGIPFLRGRVGDWGDGNLFAVHNWWHLSLFELEAGHHAEVLDIYDRRLHNADAAGVPLEMLDASALLWRLKLDGIDSGNRFDELADAWASRTTDEPWYVFNDLHAAMAFAGAGRFDDAAAVVAKLEAAIADGTAASNTMMTAEVGLPATRAVLAFAEDRHDEVVETLAPIRRNLHRFGGSHAQRDVLLRTLLESALLSGRRQFAAELISERLAQRETSVYGWTRRQQLSVDVGDDATARAAASGPPPCSPASPPPDSECCGHRSVCRGACRPEALGWPVTLGSGDRDTPVHRGGMIFATRCAGCHARGPVLCRTCRFALVARPAPGAPSDIVVATAYSGRVRDVLLGLKYHNRRLVAAHVAGVLAGRLAGRAASVDVVTWAPTSGSRRRAARVRSGRADRPRRRRPSRAALSPPARARRAAARAQTGRSRRERLSGPRFGSTRGPPGRRVLVVDDVVTTGATLAAAARSLRRGGATDVVLAAVAATPDCLLPATRVA